MKALSLIVASVMPLFAYTTMAQESAPAALEEIIVTATKRSQSMQRVPMAISATGGDTMASSGITEARALPQIAPSLFISTSTSESAGTQVRLRGGGLKSGVHRLCEPAAEQDGHLCFGRHPFTGWHFPFFLGPVMAFSASVS